MEDQEALLGMGLMIAAPAKLRTWRPMAAWTGGILLALGTAVMVWVGWSSSTYKSSKLTVEWRETGRPSMVEGRIVDSRGTPVCGLGVTTDDSSGGSVASTDSSGCFAIQAGETEISALQIEGMESIHPWPWHVVGLSTQRGIWFDVQLRGGKPEK